MNRVNEPRRIALSDGRGGLYVVAKNHFLGFHPIESANINEDQADRQTDRQTDRPTERATDRPTDQTDSQPASQPTGQTNGRTILFHRYLKHVVREFCFHRYLCLQGYRYKEHHRHCPTQNISDHAPRPQWPRINNNKKEHLPGRGFT